jgi:hypothetical protein
VSLRIQEISFALSNLKRNEKNDDDQTKQYTKLSLPFQCVGTPNCNSASAQYRLLLYGCLYVCMYVFMWYTIKPQSIVPGTVVQILWSPNK